MQNTVKIMKIDERAVIPSYAHEDDACFDLHLLLPNDYVDKWNIEPHQTVVFGTGLKFALPKGKVMKIYARSSTGIKERLMLPNGTGIIDSGYRGEVKIALTNFSNEPVIVLQRQKVAQAEICDVQHYNFEEVTELDKTERGEGGIGSTGK